MSVSVVMPHYIATRELRELATKAIQSMRKTSDVYIISVDDGSPMDVDFLRPISDIVITMDENSGFAKACNAGLEYALEQGHHYIGCANNDIEVEKGWLEALIEPFTRWDNVGITGLVGTKDREKVKDVGRKITEGGLLDEKMQSGGLWLSTKPVLREVGLFDEQFEVGGEEDVDLFLRIRDEHKKLIVMSDKSIFWHKEGATRWNEELEGFKERNKAAEDKNYERFADKWGFDIRERGLNFYEHVLEK